MNFSIQKYKAFNKVKDFEFAPITLLIGKNGSGKSNFINSLLLLKEAFSIRPEGDALSKMHEKNYDLRGIKISLGEYCLNSIIVNPFSVDGSFTKSAINKHIKDNVFELAFPLPLSYFKDDFRISLNYKVNLSDDDLKGTAELIEINIKSVNSAVTLMSVSKLERKEKHANIKINTDYVDSFLMDLHIKFKNTDPRDDGSWSKQGEYAIDYDEHIKETGREGLLKRLNTPFNKAQIAELRSKTFHPEINYEDTPSLLDLYRRHQSLKPLDEAETKNSNSANLKNAKLFLKELNNEGIIVPQGVADIFNTLTGYGLLFIDGFWLPYDTFIFGYDKKKEKARKFDPNKELELLLYELILRNIGNAVSCFCNHLNEYSYIPPSRNNFYRSTNQFSNTEITNKIRTQLFDIINRDIWRNPYLNFFNNWIKELGLPDDYKLENLRTLIDILDAKNNLLSNSGYGINQLIPLLASISFFNQKFDYSSFDRFTDADGGISNTKNASNMFLIEEPEANLHPNFQSKLADILIDSAWKFGHNFIIETHSEYMVRKFQYWVAKGKIKPSDVNIYYFDNQNENPNINDVIINKISINKDGSLSEPFGEGFFDEADKIALELFLLNKHQSN